MPRRAEQERNLGVVRAVSAVAILAYMLSWVANREVPGFRDPLSLRLGISTLILAAAIGTWSARWVVENLAAVLRFLVYVVTLHDFLLLYWNALHPLQVVGTYLVLSGVVATSPLFLTSRGQLLTYLSTVGLLSVAVAVMVTNPATARPQFLIGIGTFAILAGLALRSHLRALAELRESEGQTRAVLRAVPDLLVRLGAGGAIEAVLGDPAGPLADRTRTLVGRPLDELVEREPAAPGAPSQRGRVLLAEGAVHVEIRVVDAGDGGRLALIRDIGWEKGLEDRLRVTDRLAAIGTLASGVAHEINNPLAYVMSNVEYVMRELEKEGGKSERVAALADAAEGAERVRRIVSTLKQYAAGPSAPELDASVEDCVEAALKMLDHQLRHRARLEVDVAGAPRVLAEPFRLTQVLVNLLGNALQAVPGPDRAEGRIGVRARGGPDDTVVIEVSDDGKGIPPAQLARVFDPFFTTKPPGEGTGLGLWVCHQTVTAFGGTIEVESQSGHGTTFRIQLSSAQRKRTGPPPADTEGAAIGVPILVVDDEPRVARSLARLLRGEDVTVAFGGASALKLCRQRDFGLILCDVMMPDVDGRAFYKELAAGRPDLARRVVFMTGGAFTPEARAFLDGTGNPWLEKPLTRAAIVAAARALGGAETSAG